MRREAVLASIRGFESSRHADAAVRLIDENLLGD
jgi:hypothetical protein